MRRVSLVLREVPKGNVSRNEEEKLTLGTIAQTRTTKGERQFRVDVNGAEFATLSTR